MYVSPNYETKAALKKAIEFGDTVHVFQPGLGSVPDSGVVSVEGPHAPRPHTWYARVKIENKKIVKVIS